MTPQTSPSPNCRYYVDTATKGRLFFETLPTDNTLYWGEGFQDPTDFEKAFFYTWDTGTCLIPFRRMDGAFVYKQDLTLSLPPSPRSCRWCGSLYAGSGWHGGFCGHSCAGNHHDHHNNNSFSDADSGL